MGEIGLMFSLSLRRTLLSRASSFVRGNATSAALAKEFPGFHEVPRTRYVEMILTAMRDGESSRDDFVFFSNQLMRLVMQETLDKLPHKPQRITTPTGVTHEGLAIDGTVSTVSILRSGEAMEASARALLRSVPLGKVLVQRDEETLEPVFYFSKLPAGVEKHNVILLDPMVATGGSANMVLDCITKAGVPQKNIIFSTVISCPEGVRKVFSEYPGIQMVTGALDSNLNSDGYIMPGLGDFGDRYYGTHDEAQKGSTVRSFS